MTLKAYFNEFSAPMPTWLSEYDSKQTINYKEVLASPFVYYPGSAFDGEPIRTFNLAKAVYTYVYVDFAKSFAEVKAAFTIDGLRGYQLIGLHKFNVKKEFLSSTGNLRTKKIIKERINSPHTFHIPHFGVLAIYERLDTYDENHGQKRLAIMFLAEDAIEMFAYLFNEERAPYILVLQDHGFSGNYTFFGRGGLLEIEANAYNITPKYCYVACNNTKAWKDYTYVKEISYPLLPPDGRGRRLYKLAD